jgi:hypothetical protein
LECLDITAWEVVVTPFMAHITKVIFSTKKDVKILTNCWISDKQGNGKHFVACTENNLAT